MDDEPKKPSYLGQAFMNVYNLTLLGGAMTASALTGEYVLGAVAVGVEALWLLFAPDLHPWRRAVDRWHRDDVAKKEKQRLTKMMESLPEREWARAHALDELKREIERDMQQNPSFQALLLSVELDKLAQLQSSFVRLATSCTRAEAYLGASDAKDLQRQIDVQKNLEKSMGDAGVQELARKNAQVLERRLASIQEIKNFLARARGQMNLIENSVRLMRDQVLTMASPDQLGEQLDDLLRGVAVVQDSALEHEGIFSRVDVAAVAPISSEEPDARMGGRTGVGSS